MISSKHDKFHKIRNGCGCGNGLNCIDRGFENPTNFLKVGLLANFGDGFYRLGNFKVQIGAGGCWIHDQGPVHHFPWICTRFFCRPLAIDAELGIRQDFQPGHGNADVATTALSVFAVANIFQCLFNTAQLPMGVLNQLRTDLAVGAFTGEVGQIATGLMTEIKIQTVVSDKHLSQRFSAKHQHFAHFFQRVFAGHNSVRLKEGLADLLYRGFRTIVRRL
jgi:hypothetical protein